MKKCKKCLLLEAGENKSYNTIKEYLDNIDTTLKTDKCGCYVEVRAAFNDKHCADFNNKTW